MDELYYGQMKLRKLKYNSSIKIFYDGDDNAQERYVAAECEAIAWKKLYDYLDQQCKAGFQFPRCICDPTVSAENVIV